MSESSSEISVLLVEDSPTQSLAIKVMLEKTGHQVIAAADGEEALRRLDEDRPDVVLTDWNLPGVSGLELLKVAQDKFPNIPVIVMTSDGDEAVAATALKHGAASFVGKHKSMGALLETIDRIVQASTSGRSFGYLMDSVQQCHYSFRLANDRGLVVSLTQYVQHLATRAGLTDQQELRNLGVAVEEALLNALYHGSLEVPESFRDMEQDERTAVVESRRQSDPYQHRKIYVTADVTPDIIELVIRDEGPGFDYEQHLGGLDDDSDPDATGVMASTARGLMLIQMFMDEVTYQGAGNEVRLVKHLTAASP